MALELTRTIFSGLLFLSVIIAFLSYRRDIKISKDKELLDQALLSLSWAYDALTKEGKNSYPPKADRLNWLTSARHLCRYKTLSNLIKTDTYRLICSEHEEFWRHKFYISLEHKDLRREEYFMDKRNLEWPENIQLDSAKIINSFANWPSGLVDPLNEEAHKNFDTEKQMFKGNAGIGIAFYSAIFEKIKTTMDEEYKKQTESSSK